jgi:phage-related protein
LLLKGVVWLGDRKEAVSGFPTAIREDLGFQLYQMQQGKAPSKSRPMKSIGSGV